ncbi:MAG TPA: V-type ATPase 116kDa subunit family protein, partial [Candidatus Krumholzibacterium sp.]|nr:V-type ATPase 116kDa subunit family protein [Candidatus Krumholzibacterium sp.]
MFTPERMHQINVMVFETEVDEVAKAIVRLGILHLVQLDDRQPWVEQLGTFDAGRVSDKIDRLGQRTVGLMKDLGIRELPLEERDSRLLEVSVSDLDEMEKEMTSLEARVQGLVGRKKELEVHLERMQGIFNEISPLSEVGLTELKTPYTFLEIRYGQVRSEHLGYIMEKTAPLAAAVFPLATRGDSEVILLIGLKTDRLKLKRILREAAFEDIDMPSGDDEAGDSAIVIEGLEGKIEEIKEKIAAIKEELAEIKEKHSGDITDFHRSLRVTELLLRVKNYLKKTRKTYIFSGWVPSDRKREVEREIMRVARGRSIIEIIPPEEITGVKEGSVKVPVMLKHPGFFRPFEMLVSSYGLPEYKFIDPTFFVAISFLIMFGMMFGDVGHGAILVWIGWMLGFRKPKDPTKPINEGTRLVGKLGFWCGMSSIVFGLLYGSIFGLEELFHGLWMKPMHNVIYFFKVAVYFGISFISVGILLNVINAVRARDFKSTFFDQAGLVSAILYWCGIGAVSIFLKNRPIPIMLLVLGLGFPVLLLFLREPLAAAFGKRRMRFEKGLMTYIMETVIEVMEIVTGY